MASSVWTGYLTFGLISMPVRLFSGARGERISFHMLHRKDHVRVKQQYICPEDGEVMDRANDIVKGYEYKKGEYVIIDPAEIKAIEPKTAKAMEILEFVKQEEIDPVYFESSYYLMPEEAGRRPYALLTKAMQDAQYVGIAKLTMHNREYTVFLRPTAEGGIMLHTMYYQDEVRQVEGFGEIVKNVEVKSAEIKVAHQLIEALASHWEPEKYHDTFEENVKKLIEARIEGKNVIPIDKPKKPAPVADLMTALKESLANMEGKKKAPQRVAAAEAESEVEVTPAKSVPKKGRKKGAA